MDMPEGTFTSPDLPSVLEYLRSLKCDGFDPDASAWQPATSRTYATSAEWSVDAPQRGLGLDDSALDAHAGDTLP